MFRLTLPALQKDLRRHGDSSTFVRLGISQHVVDLRLIFMAIATVASCSILLVLAISIVHIFTTQIYSWDGIITELGKIGPFVGAIGGIACSILAWVYLTGSARLGVVDLFAYEILTLTRVGTIVDVARTLTARLQTSVAASAQDSMVSAQMVGRFSSTENYFTVFETTTGSLQQLEANVVRNVTAFYTYIKTMRDYLRGLSDIQSGQSQASEALRATIVNIVYMLYLAYESARKAVIDLIEYEPDRDEAVMVILMTELQAYRCLLSCFPDGADRRHRLLMLRKNEYLAIIAELRIGRVATDQTAKWAPARALVDDLDELCGLIFGHQEFAQALENARKERQSRCTDKMSLN